MKENLIDRGYLEEKAMNNLKEIVGVVETLNSSEAAIPANVFNDLAFGLRITLHDATTMVAVLNNVTRLQDMSDIELIMQHGGRGLEQVLFKYGCSVESEEMRKERKRPELALRILELSKGDRGTSRNAIYDEIQRHGRDELTDHVDILLEGVTQNTKEWGQFQLEIEHFLTPFCTGGESTRDERSGADFPKTYFGRDE